MKWFEVLLIAASVLFVLGVTVASAVKRKKGAGGCDCCDCGSCPAHCRCKSDVSQSEPQKR